MWLFSLLPLRVLYLFSDIVYGLFVLCPPLRYRRRIVRRNLESSFPDKSSAWLGDTERRFYRNFCDLFFAEMLKTCSLSAKSVARRMTFTGIGQLESTFSEGRSAILYLGHLYNWEWVTSIGLHFSPENVAAHVYHPLENRTVDEVFCHIRQRYGAVNVPMDRVLRRLLEFRSEGRPFVLGMIADQVPLMWSIGYWTDFLNHDTPVFTGSEKIARKLDTAVYYGEMTKVRRGHYNVNIRLICDHPSELPENEITERYFRMLEQTVRTDPALWLWSHNRWKRTRESYHKWLAGKGKRQ